MFQNREGKLLQERVLNISPLLLIGFVAKPSFLAVGALGDKAKALPRRMGGQGKYPMLHEKAGVTLGANAPKLLRTEAVHNEKYHRQSKENDENNGPGSHLNACPVAQTKGTGAKREGE